MRVRHVAFALTLLVLVNASQAAEWSRDDAAHLLRRAGFGGTPEQIDKLHALGKAGAVEYLLSGELPAGKEAPFAAVKLEAFKTSTPEEMEDRLPPPLARRIDEQVTMQLKERNLPDNEQTRHRLRLRALDRAARQLDIQRLRSWWIDRMVRTDRPLEEKMTLFWHGLFTSGIREVGDSHLMAYQAALFHEQALGNYKRLTQSILHDGAMLRYLNADQNIRRKPNENLARELMELFTMGEGNGYTEADIKEVARALTGLAVDREQGVTFRMRRHDPAEKKILGKTGKFGPDDVVDIIFERPQPAPYLSKRLWQFFGTPDPAPADVAKVAVVLKASNYEIKPALKALFMSDSFYSEEMRFTLIKSPVELMVETMRQLEVQAPQGERLANALRQMGQDLFQPPNVRGWPGGEHWITSATLFMRYNTVGTVLDGALSNNNAEGRRLANAPARPRLVNAERNGQGEEMMMQQEQMDQNRPPTREEFRRNRQNRRGMENGGGVRLEKLLGNNLEKEMSPDALVDLAIARYLQRPLNPAKRDALIKTLGEDAVKLTDRAHQRKVREMIGLLLSTPEYQVH